MLIRAALVVASLVAVGWSEPVRAVRVDIDGDGSRDSVTLARGRQSFVVRVDTGHRVITKRVRGFSGPQAAGIGDPRIAALRPINAQGGLEIEVEVWHGAANSWLIVYTLDHGRLVPMRYDAQRTHFVKAKVYELASEQMLTQLPKDWPQVKRLDVASCGGVTVAQ